MLVIGVVFIVANFLVDLLQLWLNPRLREVRRAAMPAATVAGTALELTP